MKLNSMNTDLLNSLLEQGYIEVKEMDGVVVGLLPFAYTVGIVVNIDHTGYSRRYCYPKSSDAFKDFKEWGGKHHPKGNWIKCKGTGIDILNENYHE